MTVEFRIRYAERSDADFIADMLSRNPALVSAPPLSKILNVIMDKAVLVAESDGSVIGVASLHVYSKILGELRWLYVEEEYRGMGVGTALAESIVGMARDRGLSLLVALVHPDNKPALRVIEKIGMTPLYEFKSRISGRRLMLTAKKLS